MPPKMYPAVLPDDVLSDPKRSGEIQVFEALKSDPSLNEKWRIFYSLDWIGEYEGTTRDGEADFVVAHPDIGFLVIEVKGGEVTVKPGPKWTSIDRHDEEHIIENGMLQAMKSKKVLLNALIEAWDGHAPFFRARHGVILPHSSEPDPKVGDLAKGMPRELFVFKGQMDRLGLRIRELINWNAPGADDKIGLGGEKGIEIFERLYGREISLKNLLGDEIKDVEKRIVELSENQKRVLGLLKAHKRCLIQGAAGTGKTVIAKEKAIKDIKSGEKVLFLCFNRLLKERVEADLRRTLTKIENDRLAVHTFHGLCRSVTDRAKREDETDEDYFSEILPAALHSSVLDANLETAGLPLSFNSLVVDEGQDFADDWFDIVHDLVELNEAAVAVFQDGNQSIYRNNRVADLFKVSPLILSENFRNSIEIFELVSRYVGDEDFVSLGPHGPSVRAVKIEASKIEQVVKREIDVLIETEGVASEDIVILSGASVGTEDAIVMSPGIERHSIWEFKGLDSPVVVLTDLGNALRKAELAYVGVSRARSLLLLVDTEEKLDRLMSELPQKLGHAAATK
jgi:hypothetical protein